MSQHRNKFRIPLKPCTTTPSNKGSPNLLRFSLDSCVHENNELLSGRESDGPDLLDGILSQIPVSQPIAETEIEDVPVSAQSAHTHKGKKPKSKNAKSFKVKLKGCESVAAKRKAAKKRKGDENVVIADIKKDGKNKIKKSNKENKANVNHVEIKKKKKGNKENDSEKSKIDKPKVSATDKVKAIFEQMDDVKNGYENDKIKNSDNVPGKKNDVYEYIATSPKKNKEKIAVLTSHQMAKERIRENVIHTIQQLREEILELRKRQDKLRRSTAKKLMREQRKEIEP